MNNFNQTLRAFLSDEEGLTTVEYAIAGSLVAAGVIVSFGTLGDKVKAVIDYLGTEIKTP